MESAFNDWFSFMSEGRCRFLSTRVSFSLSLKFTMLSSSQIITKLTFSKTVSLNLGESSLDIHWRYKLIDLLKLDCLDCFQGWINLITPQYYKNMALKWFNTCILQSRSAEQRSSIPRIKVGYYCSWLHWEQECHQLSSPLFPQQTNINTPESVFIHFTYISLIV